MWSFFVYHYETLSFERRANTVIEQEQRRSNLLAQSVVADLQRSLRTMQGLPYVLANQAHLISALRASPKLPFEVEAANARKQRLREQNMREPWRAINLALASAGSRLSFDLAYVLDRNGDCLASSDYQSTESLIGNNYRERHYFKAAMNGEPGYQFAIGKTSRTPGLYFSAPVFDGEEIVAVMVAKIEISRLAQDIDLTGIFLIDENGVVILAQDHSQEMKALANGLVHQFPAEKRKSLYSREQFPSFEIEAWTDSRFPTLKQIGSQTQPFVVGRLQLNERPLEVMSAIPVEEISLLENQKTKTILLSSIAGGGVLVILSFITLYFLESAATRTVLETQRKRLSEAQGLAAMGSWTIDLGKRTMVCSDAALALLRIDEVGSEFSFDQFLQLVHPDDRAEVSQQVQRAFDAHETLHMSFRLLGNDGEQRFVVGDGRLVSEAPSQELLLEGTIRDITKYQVLVNALESSESHLKKVINACLIGIVQGRDDGILYGANSAFLELTGYTLTQLQEAKLNWLTLTPEKYRSSDAQLLDNLQAAQTSSTYETEIICADGRTIPVLVGLALIDEQAREWVAFVLDLSERNRVQRLQAEFIAIVSHELRTPLTSIRGSLALVENGVLGTLPDKALHMIGVAHRNSVRLSKLVNDILDMERLDSGKMKLELKSINLVDFLPHVVEANIDYAVSEAINLNLELGVSSACIWADEERLYQILGNLISNAMKFSPVRSSVKLRLEEDGTHWVVHVIDVGPGIPVEFQAVLFDSFTQADNSDTRQKQGSGLGLKIAKSLVELMHGSIGFTSSSETGTDFWIRFKKYAESNR